MFSNLSLIYFLKLKQFNDHKLSNVFDMLRKFLTANTWVVKTWTFNISQQERVNIVYLEHRILVLSEEDGSSRDRLDDSGHRIQNLRVQNAIVGLRSASLAERL